MQTIKKSVAEKILAAVQEVAAEATLTAEEIAAMLEYPPDASMGDLAFPCFRLSKTLRRSPVQIAASLCEKVNGGCIEKVEAVGGYLNLTIANSYLGNVVIPEILEKACFKESSTSESKEESESPFVNSSVSEGSPK